MASFEDTDGDGIGNVPDYYNTLHDRKKVEDSRSLSALLKKPNRFAFILLGLILTVILLVVCLVLLLRKLVRKLRRRKKHVKIAQCRTACGLSGIVFSQSESPFCKPSSTSYRSRHSAVYRRRISSLAGAMSGTITVTKPPAAPARTPL